MKICHKVVDVLAYAWQYLVDGMNSAPFGILSIGASQAVAGDMALHVDKKHVYVLTGSKVCRKFVCTLSC